MPVEADKSASAGAPENEIEITPQMIEAGVEELSSHYLELQEGTDQFGALVKTLFARMWEAR